VEAPRFIQSGEIEMKISALMKTWFIGASLLAGIGMAGNRQTAKYLPLDNVAGLLQMKVPVLDIYGSQTNPIVLESVDRRAFAIAVTAYQPGNRYSRQIRINGANQFFQGHEHELLQVITNWMTRFILSKQANN